MHFVQRRHHIQKQHRKRQDVSHADRPSHGQIDRRREYRNMNVMAPLNEVHRVLDEGYESSLLVGDLMEMIEEPPDRSYQTASPEEPAMNGDGLIQMDNLKVQLAPEESRKPALENVSLDIRRGEIIGIAGRSGCGKSTLLRALLGWFIRAEGQVAWEGFR